VERRRRSHGVVRHEGYDSGDLQKIRMKIRDKFTSPGLHRTRYRAAVLLLGGVLLAVAILIAASASPIRGDDLTATNIVEKFQQQLDSGSAKLSYASTVHGYLPDLLRAFHVPRLSQLLVFSASSMQFDRINQKTPRAIYYQDDIAVGSVRDGRFIEIIATDKKSGIAFYTLDVAKTDQPRFVRRMAECIVCHGFASRWAPGLMVADTDTGPEGQLINIDPNRLFRLTDERTPFDARYGGWYLTGNTGAMPHRGNVTLDPALPSELPTNGRNILSLSDRFDVAHYLEPGSDVVSLLTLEHQAGLVSLITRINAQYLGLDNASAVPALQATKNDIDVSIKELIAYMTFADEVPLPSAVQGSSKFAQMFADQGPRDAQGRSLRQFDLNIRVFRYPLSFMIYSQAFDNLNPLAKERVWRGLYDVLSGTDKGPAFADLDKAKSTAAINILAATKAGLPDYWKPVEEHVTQKY
jgi:hypothetical protein